MKNLLLIITVLMLIVGCSAKKKPPKSSINQTTDKHTQEQPLTKQPSGKSLVGHDWVYPDMENMMAAWKFMDDGTFNVSQKMFGGSTRYGKWKDLGNGKVQLTYDDGGFVKGTQVKATDTITIISKTQFQLGSTIYRRY